jgi:hypothetical protein
MMTSFIGVDPGKHGAVAIINDTGKYFVEDFENETHAAEVVRNWWWENPDLTVFIEKVHAFPGQGGTSMFTFGVNFGIWRGIFAALSIPAQFVAPQAWQAAIFSKYSGDSIGKTRSIDVARGLFPKADLRLKKHDGRAEALLIAFYGKMET